MEHDGIVLKLTGKKLAGVRNATLSAFEGLGQGAVAAATLDFVSGFAAIASLFKAAGEVSLQDTKEHIAFRLITEALTRALDATLAEIELTREPGKGIRRGLANTMVDRLAEGSVIMRRDFLAEPSKFDFLETFGKDVVSHFGDFIYVTSNDDVLRSLRRHFAPALDRTWLEHPTVYAVLEESLKSPFSEAVQRDRERRLYRASLVKAFESELLFGQEDERDPVRLVDVFVPLRAWYSVEPQEDPN